MGITMKKGKAPVGLPTSSALANTHNVGTSKATKQARKLAARKARINKECGVAPAKEYQAAPTTEGRIRATGGGTQILQNKSTAYVATVPDKMVANVNGKLVTLGRRDTYTPEDKARIEAEEHAAGANNTGRVHASLYGSQHHKTRHPRSLIVEASRDRSTSVKIGK